jgi:hypothetical protein
VACFLLLRVADEGLSERAISKMQFVHDVIREERETR